MVKNWRLPRIFALAIMVSLLYGGGVYAGTGDTEFDIYQPIVDFVPLVADIDAADGDQTTDNTDKQNGLAIAADRDEPGRYRDLQRFSKPAGSQTATLTVHRLKYEVPWQYWQA